MLLNKKDKKIKTLKIPVIFCEPKVMKELSEGGGVGEKFRSNKSAKHWYCATIGNTELNGIIMVKKYIYVIFNQFKIWIHCVEEILLYIIFLLCVMHAIDK